MNHLTAVQHAQHVYEARDTATRESRINEAVSLGEWGVYSNRQIAAFTALRPALVNELNPKTSRTGGRLKPESLGAVVAVCRMVSRKEMDATVIAAALSAGCSSIMLARLTGASQSTLSRWARKADA